MDEAGLLNSMTVEQLKVTCERLQRSCKDMEMLLGEFEQEQALLRREQDRLHQRVERITAQADSGKKDRSIIWSVIDEVDKRLEVSHLFRAKEERKAAKRRRWKREGGALGAGNVASGVAGRAGKARRQGGTGAAATAAGEEDGGPFSDANIQLSWGNDVSYGILRPSPLKGLEEELDRWVREAVCGDPVAEAEALTEGARMWDAQFNNIARTPPTDHGSRLTPRGSTPPPSRSPAQSQWHEPTTQRTRQDRLEGSPAGRGKSREGPDGCHSEGEALAGMRDFENRASLPRQWFQDAADLASNLLPAKSISRRDESPRSTVSVMVELTRSGAGKWGLAWDNVGFNKKKEKKERVVQKLEEGSVAEMWNKNQDDPDRRIQAGDRLHAVNGKTHPDEIKVELQGSTVTLEFRRNVSRRALSPQAPSPEVKTESEVSAPTSPPKSGMGSRPTGLPQKPFRFAFAEYLTRVAPVSLAAAAAAEGDPNAELADRCLDEDPAQEGHQGTGKLAGHRLDDVGSAEQGVKKQCPKDHDLVIFETQDEFACHSCNRIFPRGTWLAGCRPCGYNLCETCFGGVGLAPRRHRPTLPWDEEEEEGVAGGARGTAGSSTGGLPPVLVEAPHSLVVQVLSLGAGSLRLSWIFDWAAAPPDLVEEAWSEKRFQVAWRQEESGDGASLPPCALPALTLELPVGHRYTFKVCAMLVDAREGSIGEVAWTSPASPPMSADLRTALGPSGLSPRSAVEQTPAPTPTPPRRGVVASKLGSFLASAQRPSPASAPSAYSVREPRSPAPSSPLPPLETPPGSVAAEVSPARSLSSEGSAAVVMGPFPSPLTSSKPRLSVVSALDPIREKKDVVELLRLRFQATRVASEDSPDLNRQRSTSVDSDDEGSLLRLSCALSSLERTAAAKLRKGELTGELVAEEGHHSLEVRLDSGQQPVRPAAGAKAGSAPSAAAAAAAFALGQLPQDLTPVTATSARVARPAEDSADEAKFDEVPAMPNGTSALVPVGSAALLPAEAAAAGGADSVGARDALGTGGATGTTDSGQQLPTADGQASPARRREG